MYATSVPTPLNSRYSYHAILSDICKTRFNHLAIRLLLTISVTFGAVLTFLTRWDVNAWERVLLFPGKVILLYIGLILVIITRKNYLRVQFLGYANIVSFLYGQFFSLKFIFYHLTYLASGILITWALNGVLYDPSYSIPVALRRLNVWLINPSLYTAQLLVFDLERLSFSFGFQHEDRQFRIAGRLHDSAVKCGILTLCVLVFQPIIYFVLNVKESAGVLAHLQCCAISFIIFQLWDITNVAFNAYLSIGCLHRGKPISSLSSTPMETLVTGLSSKRLFTKLTAFQELSYRATSPDIQLRLPIYHTRYGNSHIWSSILRECLLVIQESNSNISMFLKSLEAQSTATSSDFKQKNIMTRNKDEVLFGNKPTVSVVSGSQFCLPGSPPSAESDISQRITLESNGPNFNGQRPQNLMQFSHSYNPPIFTQQVNFLNLAQDLMNYVTKMLSSFFFPSQIESTTSVKPLFFFELWTISKKAQAEKLVKLPNCYAECVIALMGMLINSLDEDPKGSVVSSVGEVLKILERSVGSLGAFVEWEPPNKSQKGPDSISVIYDLAINAFLEIVLKYNQLLNDVYLDDDVVKLSQWVLQMCDDNSSI
ncbi:HFL244Wp [Eremothecium sinecaudum]|uniref:HFL244Wp n=1 Tax=Eremothecium sinecaudum TaxID=45286 RepID=A0A0X8HUB8_9SACH|nr:HFL244Wp [Eremothecium sinecaudum]AMD21612.1 HFL244Wp [Eremothecium sinecaudum]